MLQKYKSSLLAMSLVALMVLAILHLRELILPFIFGLVLAVMFDPVVRRIQRRIKNRVLATTTFLLGSVLILGLFTWLSVSFVNRDFKRLNHSFEILTTRNQDKLDATSKWAKEWVAKIYQGDKTETILKQNADSLEKQWKKQNFRHLDLESIQSGLEKMSRFLPESHENDAENVQNNKPNIFFMMLLSVLYFVLILYQYDYFISLREKYISANLNSKLHVVNKDIQETFVSYLRLRTKIILYLSAGYVLTFLILDMPGLIFITLLIALLSYIPYLQYLALIPISLSCLVLSIESGQPFLLSFCIVTGVFILFSILDDFWLTPRIIERVFKVNFVILVFAFSIWTYLFGWLGVLLGVPMTSFAIRYIKRYFLPASEAVFRE